MITENYYSLKEWTCRECGATSCYPMEKAFNPSHVIHENEARLYRVFCYDCGYACEILMADGCVLTYTTYEADEPTNRPSLHDAEVERVGFFSFQRLAGSNWDPVTLCFIDPDLENWHEIPF